MSRTSIEDVAEKSGYSRIGSGKHNLGKQEFTAKPFSHIGRLKRPNNLLLVYDNLPNRRKLRVNGNGDIEYID